jgi:hypothetical protein
VPRPSRTGAIPAQVKRAVWLRAGGRCEWVLESGERCDCTRKLEYDHIILAVALGGKSTLDNVRLACRPHNLLAARQAFGDTGWIGTRRAVPRRCGRRRMNREGGAATSRPFPALRACGLRARRASPACHAPLTRFSCADRAAPVPALGTGPQPAPRLEPARNRSPGDPDARFESRHRSCDESSGVG